MTKNKQNKKGENKMEKKLANQIKNELKKWNVQRTVVTHVEINHQADLVMFKADGINFWGKLTPTGRIKTRSLRISKWQ